MSIATAHGWNFDMRFRLLILILCFGCSLDTDLIRERDATPDAADAAADASADTSVDTFPDALDAMLDSTADTSPDTADACVEQPEMCNASDDDCDGRVDEAVTGCDGSCIDGTCRTSGNVDWVQVLGTTAGDGTAATDRVLALAATSDQVFAAGQIQGDAFAWMPDTAPHVPNGTDGFVATMDTAGMPLRLATMSSGGTDVARGLILQGDTLWSVGVVTGTATIAGLATSGATTGFLAEFTFDSAVATSATRIDTTTELDAVAQLGDGVVATGTVRGRLMHPMCPDLTASTIGLVLASDWCVVLGEAGDQVFPRAVTTDGMDVYVAATVVGDATIDGTPVSGGSSGALLVKLNEGAVIWSRMISSPTSGHRAGGNAVTTTDVDGETQIVMGGQLVGDFTDPVLSATDEDPYLVAYDASGDVVWAQTDAQPFSGGVFALASDNNTLVVGGWHAGVSFGCPMIPTVPGNGEDGFVAHLDASSRGCDWVETIASAGLDRVRALAFDPERAIVYAGGELSDGAIVEADPISVAGTGTDGFVVAYVR